MCGICGALSQTLEQAELRHRAERAVELLVHRGPDGNGVWLGDGVALGHVRLSILDLREAAGQPMHSSDQRWVLTYNGEIYNFREVRRELVNVGVSFRTTSDTEVLVEAIAKWGIERTLGKLNGMFAFAAWNTRRRTLVLARDRAGQKPLFYGHTDEGFFFGSELRAVRAFVPSPTINVDACALMLRYKCIPEPLTIYEGFQKLPPGHFVEFDLEANQLSPPKRYWRPDLARRPVSKQQLREAFDMAVERRMVSDVPLGAFLSGGIDSSVVVASMQKFSSASVKTFTIGFADSEVDESSHARAVASHLGTKHTELVVTQQDLLDVVPNLPKIYDEPFGDSSQIPTVLVSNLARQSVTVALSGDGGDEAFAGYNRHRWLPNIARLSKLSPARHAFHRGLRWEQLDTLLPWLSDRGVLPVRMVRDKLDKLRSLLSAEDEHQLYRSAVSDIDDPERLFMEKVQSYVAEATFGGCKSAITEVCLADFGFYLPNDILVKVDRASMSCGLEARSPFLDHELLELAFAAPDGWKLNREGGKSIVRQWLSEALPRELFNRPKMGFAIPLASWLRNELKAWGEDLLHSRWLRSGFLDEAAVLRLWEAHQRGQRRHHHLLWNILMLLAWLEENHSSVSA